MGKLLQTGFKIAGDSPYKKAGFRDSRRFAIAGVRDSGGFAVSGVRNCGRLALDGVEDSGVLLYCLSLYFHACCCCLGREEPGILRTPKCFFGSVLLWATPVLEYL